MARTQWTLLSGIVAAAAFTGPLAADMPKFEDVAKDYERVVTTNDGSLYNIWVRKKDGQMLAELPRNCEAQNLFIAYTIAGGIPTAGVQTGDMYVTWKRYDDRLALIEPNVAVRTSGDLESRKGYERVFTDRVVLDVPIITHGPSGGPVIDMDALLVHGAGNFFGNAVAGANPRLATIAKAKTFPQNVELAFELPMRGGRLGTLHYSLSVIPNSTGYQPREADERIGYFTTAFRDLGDASADTPWKRYINRWKLEKADPKLNMSPPKEPIVFYLEHTIPVRYRRWVRDGVLEWNRAFEQIGIDGAIQVYQQDARTGAHMDKDPEDARYNFLLWTNAGMGFAIGPSRVHPETGQILDADIVMDEGFITSWAMAYKKLLPQVALEGMGPQTLAWLAERPEWDPRVLLAEPAERDDVRRTLAMEYAQLNGATYGGHPAAQVDGTLLGDDRYDGLAGRQSQVSGRCDNLLAKSMDIALFRLNPQIFAEIAAGLHDDEDEDDADEPKDDDSGDDDGEGGDADDADDSADDEDGREATDILDGMPDWFIGPLLKSVIMHEVGHTLGLRHNFKASTIYGLEHVNCEDHKGHAITGSVMDYNPVNINFEDGPAQGEYAMTTLGPYDYWAIEYGYTFKRDLKPILERVADDELLYATDEDTWGPDPRARRFDFGKDPLNYADSQMRLVQHLRTEITDRMVKDGEPWSEARQAYEILLGRHFSALSIATNWIGGAYVNRDRKGDPGDRSPVEMIPAETQRRALQFAIDHAFDPDAFGLTPELLGKMTVTKWWDDGGRSSLFQDETWPVHDRILSIQSSILTMIMNPQTLNRVYNNEFIIAAEEDALTLPEVITTIGDAVWTELDARPAQKYTAREPMIHSLRRNLQREHLDRLIELSMPNQGFGPAAMPISNLCVQELRELRAMIGDVMDRAGAKLDPYTEAHLAEAQVRIEKALDAQYIYNTDDIGGGGMPFILFGQPEGDPAGPADPSQQ